MIIENIKDKMIVLYAEGSNKITDSKKSFFTNSVFLPINSDISKYIEVSRDIWRAYIENDGKDFDILYDKIEEQTEVNTQQGEMILSSMDAIAENYETSLSIQNDNNTQDEMILSTMESVADSYEQMLNIETATSKNQDNVLVSMDAIAELYETVLNLQMELEALKGGDSNGNSNGDNIL